METVGLISLGCARNLVDSEVMLGAVKLAGFHISRDPDLCDIIIVNTCGFIEDSKKESIDAILEMAAKKKTGRLKKLVMAGCLTQRYSAQLAKELPEVDLFVGTGEYPKIVEYLEAEAREIHVDRPRALYDEASPRVLATPKHHAYVKLAEGCRHTCSFCVIPQLRGGLRSRSIDSLVTEVRQLQEQGVKEFNLIAQDSTDFGKDRHDGATLEKLFEKLASIEGENWFRLFYAYPHGFPYEVLEVMRDHPPICDYLDIPIQHINDRLLTAMRREGTGRDIRELVARFRKTIPDVTLRTTLIVGYPGETDAEFQELADFIAEKPFDHVGVFTYSPEEGTRAFVEKDDVPGKIKRERKKEIMKIQSAVSKKRNERFVGRTLKVLIDGPSKESEMIQTARHQGQAPEVDGVIYLNECDLPAGTFAEATIVEAHEYDLIGKII